STPSTHELLALGRRLVDLVAEAQPATIGVSVHDHEPAAAARVAEAMLSAILARYAGMPSFKQAPAPPPRLRQVRLLGIERADRFARSFAEAEGNALARALAALPPNVLTPTEYRRRIAALARTNGWAFEYLDRAALRRRGAGAFLAV